MRNKFLGFICLLYSILITYNWYFDKLKWEEMDYEFEHLDYYGDAIEYYQNEINKLKQK